MNTSTEASRLDLPENAGHSVQFYQDEAILMSEVKDYLDSGLREGGTAIVIATADHLDTLRQQLQGLGTLAGQPGWFPGELVMLEASEVLSQFLVGDWPDEDRFKAVVGELVRKACAPGKQVHAFGEMVAVLCARGLYDAAIRLEQLWNKLREKHHFSLFCAYPLHLFPTEERTLAFHHICNAHDHVSASPDSAKLEGEHRVAVLEQRVLALQTELARARQSEQTLYHREKELADFLDNAAEGLHRVAPDGTILWANTAELTTLGYRWEEYVGHHVADFHVDQAEIGAILMRLHAGDTILDQPAQMRCKDGSIKHVVINSNGCLEDGKLRYTRCFTRDATDRHLLEQAQHEREALISQLTRANEAKDEFLAMLGHELRNPLAPISAAAQLIILAAGDPERVNHASSVILRQVTHMTALIDDLLDVARVTRGLVVLELQAQDMRDAVHEAIEQALPRIRAQHQRLVVEITQDATTVRGDRKRLVQIAANLLSNATKFTPAGGEIRVCLELQEHIVKLTVTDSGIGMEPDLLSRVFDLFVQGSRTLDRTQGGLGIGLSLAKRLVDAHGGVLEAFSDGPGSGGTFTVAFPQLIEPKAESVNVREPECVMPEKALRVVIVDDNRDAADTLASLLTTAGHRSHAVYNAHDAIRMAMSACPQVFLIDIGLPELDGLALARRLRAMPEAADVVFVAVTGYGLAQDKKDTAMAGFHHHFVKPVDTDKLLHLLRALPHASAMDSKGHTRSN